MSAPADRNRPHKPAVQFSDDGALVRIQTTDTKGRAATVWVDPARGIQLAENLIRAARLALIANQEG